MLLGCHLDYLTCHLQCEMLRMNVLRRSTGGLGETDIWSVEFQKLSGSFVSAACCWLGGCL